MPRLQTEPSSNVKLVVCVTIVAFLDQLAHQDHLERTANPARLANQVNLVSLADHRRSAFHQPHQFANPAHQVHQVLLVHKENQAHPVHLEIQETLAKTVVPDSQDHKVLQAHLVNPAQMDLLAMLDNLLSRLLLLQESLDLKDHLDLKDLQVPMEALALMDSLVDLDRKDHLVPTDNPATLAKMEDLARRDHLDLQERKEFVQNIALWMAVCSSKTVFVVNEWNPITLIFIAYSSSFKANSLSKCTFELAQFFMALISVFSYTLNGNCCSLSPK